MISKASIFIFEFVGLCSTILYGAQSPNLTARTLLSNYATNKFQLGADAASCHVYACKDEVHENEFSKQDLEEFYVDNAKFKQYSGTSFIKADGTEPRNIEIVDLIKCTFNTSQGSKFVYSAHNTFKRGEIVAYKMGFMVVLGIEPGTQTYWFQGPWGDPMQFVGLPIQKFGEIGKITQDGLVVQLNPSHLPPIRRSKGVIFK